MTALALIQLADEGPLDLDARVRRYLPWFSIHSPGPILVREMLSHTAGFPDDLCERARATRTTYCALHDAQRRSLRPIRRGRTQTTDLPRRAQFSLETRPAHWPNAIEARVMTPLGHGRHLPSFTPQEIARRQPDTSFAKRPAAPLDPSWSRRRHGLCRSRRLGTLHARRMARYMRFYLNGGVESDGRRSYRNAPVRRDDACRTIEKRQTRDAAGTTLAEAPAFYRRYGFELR